jgi:intracellular multiplication protein IcmK
MLTLISGQEAIDYRVDLRIPGIGPNAVYIQNGIPDAVNPILFDVLNGIPPRGSKELKVTGGGITQAWLLNKKLYLRTNLTVTSPGWQATMSSIDGTHAYQLQPSPVILALQHGKDRIITLNIEGLE